MGKKLVVNQGTSSFDSVEILEEMLVSLNEIQASVVNDKSNDTAPTMLMDAVLAASKYSSIALNFKESGIAIHSIVNILKSATKEHDYLELVNSVLCASAMLRVLGFTEFADYLQNSQLPVLHKIIVTNRLSTVKRADRKRGATASKNAPLIESARSTWRENPTFNLDQVTEQLESSGVTKLSFDQIRELIRGENPNKGKRGRPKIR